MLTQIFRFGFVGGLATLAHVLTAMAAQAMFNLPVQGANLAGFCVAVFVSYLGHMRFTFAVQKGSGAQFLRFVVLSGLSLMTSSATVWLITTKLGASFATAMVAVAVLVPAASFVAMRLWVFSHRG
jgi:putative flippase GtrA